MYLDNSVECVPCVYNDICSKKISKMFGLNLAGSEIVRDMIYRSNENYNLFRLWTLAKLAYESEGE